MFLQPHLVAKKRIPIKYAKYLRIVIRLQYFPNPFGECLRIARLVTKIFGPDIKLIRSRIIDMSKVETLRIRTTTNKKWIQFTHFPGALISFRRWRLDSFKVWLLLNVLF